MADREIGANALWQLPCDMSSRQHPPAAGSAVPFARQLARDLLLQHHDVGASVSTNSSPEWCCCMQRALAPLHARPIDQRRHRQLVGIERAARRLVVRIVRLPEDVAEIA